MLISQLAERTGVRASTLRFYEAAGLLRAGRTASGYRTYDDDAVERLSFINTAKQLGLPLEEIAELLKVRDDGACADVRTELRSRLQARVGDAEKHVADLGTFITTLRRAVDHLDGLPARFGPCDPGCDFLAAPVQAQSAETVATAPPAEDTPRWRASPVACTLTEHALGERTKRWHQALAGATVEPVDDGLRLTLPVDRAGTVTELAAAEQQCCPFYDFRLHLDGRSLHLEVRAPAEGATMLAELFSPAL
ncbi:MerR family transcriptional regulator [Streptomyces naphthomycinicus]|uniref:MerR family transcriptional regulator n=1 Tax=Streptomyces naphthomycinicus TaxID=2872625 RepID=UPI001CEDE90D|nr:MerR family transcriptional regulator [Streptomyces sp. TML10]